MNKSVSLRARITVILLVPLVVVATLVGGWAYLDAQGNAAERFDRSLLSTALAISRDIAASGGDALSEETRDLLRDTSGGAVFYHVYAPDGVFVTGYATPPVPADQPSLEDPYTYYDARYLGEPVRALRVTQQAAVDGLTGTFTFTVWQATTVLDGFVRSRTIPVFAIIATLIGALAIIVRFGVGLGLAPLLNLEEAIERRSVEDLSPIKRSIPQEVTGIVGRLNDLLSELSASINAKDAFISDASHQLRNPIAGVIALADAVVKAEDVEKSRTRARDLQTATKELGHLTNSLLTLERIKATENHDSGDPFDANEALVAVANEFEPLARAKSVDLVITLPSAPAPLRGNVIMFQQAILNLLNNALAHGGPQLSKVTLEAAQANGRLSVSVRDNGKGIEAKDHQRALDRFSQVAPSSGAGLGLPIAAAVAQNFKGMIELAQGQDDFSVSLDVPLAASIIVVARSEDLRHRPR